MSSSSEPGHPGVTIAIGDEVHGTDGKLGTVHRVIVDADSDRISEIVVKHGFLWGNERVIPLSHVQRSDGSVLYMDIDQEQFRECDGFDPGRYREPDPDYSGPPGFNRESGVNFPLDQEMAGGPVLFYTGKPLGYPGGETIPPESEGESIRTTMPSINAGDPILDRSFQKIGEVAHLEVDEEGFPTRLVGRKGLLFRHEAELPVEWIQDFSDKGIVLNVDRSEVERLGLD